MSGFASPNLPWPDISSSGLSWSGLSWPLPLGVNGVQEIGTFRLWPPAASHMAQSVDWLFICLLAITLFATFMIFLLVAYFSLRYRRRPGVQPVQVRTHMKLEITWTLATLLIFLGVFFWSAHLYLRMNAVPEDAMQIDVVGKQWMWKIQHANGRREIDALHVPVGRKVKLLITSEDVIHSFYLPAARVKQDAVPGRYTTLWFQPMQPGRFRLECAEYCGTDHSNMVGEMIVMEPSDYAAWLAGDTDEQTEADVPLAEAGRRLFMQQGCAACHGQYGPSLAGIYGQKQQMQTGEWVTADDNYMRESILYPNAKLLKGFPPLMPTFASRLSEEQIMQLIAYIRSLGPVNEKAVGRSEAAATQPKQDYPVGNRPTSTTQPTTGVSR